MNRDARARCARESSPPWSERTCCKAEPPWESMLPVMRAHRLDGAKAQVEDVACPGPVHDLGRDLRQRAALKSDHLERVRQAGAVHVVELEPGDLHEDVAAQRLAAAIGGPGLESGPLVQSQARLTAAHRGLLRVRADLIDAMNAPRYISGFA